MSFRPAISRPCPVRDRLEAVMDGDFCRQCSATVHDLDKMTAGERLQLLGRAAGEVCVRYRAPTLLAAAVLATAALPAAAQQATVPPVAAQDLPPSPTTDAVNEMDDIVVGGIVGIPPAESARLRREAKAEAKREQRARRKAERAAP